MASLFTHAAAAFALTVPFVAPGLPRRVYAIVPLAACLPDVDVLAFRFRIPYEHPYGHRGFTHSILFALLLAAVLVNGAFTKEEKKAFGARLFTLLFLATLSHGLLDALTNGGRGVGFFVPFLNERFFFPFRPLVVSPLSLDTFFTERGLRVMRSEFLWVWIPSAVLALGAWKWGRRLEVKDPAKSHR